MENLLQCPKCFSELRRELPNFKCADCSYIVPTIGAGVPIFVEECGSNVDLRDSFDEGAEIEGLLKKLPHDAKILNVGSRLKGLKALHGGVRNLDNCYYSNVDFVADLQELPFKNDCLDAILLVDALEHTKKPADALEHVYRALKPGGYLYVNISFLRPTHAASGDYRRYTDNGIKELFKNYHEIDFGVSVGPSATLSRIIREYLAILTSFGSERLYKLGINFWGLLTFWIKYFDFFMKKNRMAGKLASCFYAIYRKPCG